MYKDDKEILFNESSLKHSEEKESELQVGDYVQIISESKILYTERFFPNCSFVTAAAFGKIAKITRIINGKYYLDDLPSIHKEIYNRHNLKVYKPKEDSKLLPIGTKIIINKNTFMGKTGVIKERGIATYVIRLDNIQLWGCTDINIYHSDVEKLKEKPEWQPKFKVGDWVVYNSGYKSLYHINSIDYQNRMYSINTFDGFFSSLKIEEQNVELWQPIQELKERNETQAKSIKTLMTEVKELKETIRKLEFDNELLKGNNQWMNREIVCKRGEIERFKEQLKLQLKDVEKLVEALAQLKSERLMA